MAHFSVGKRFNCIKCPYEVFTHLILNVVKLFTVEVLNTAIKGIVRVMYR